jgi:uncharacterized membrane protein
MGKARLEAFSDGVLAIIITIMVLEFKIPEEGGIDALLPLLPVFLSYVLSFVFIGIYWNNHHHLMHAVHKTNGMVLWANMHLLFWLSLIPFSTAWMDHHPDAPWPVALYGFLLLMAAIAYTVLVIALLRCDGQNPQLATAIGSYFKGNVSLALYILAIPSAFFYRPLSFALYVIVAMIWFIPERRIEQLMRNNSST